MLRGVLKRAEAGRIYGDPNRNSNAPGESPLLFHQHSGIFLDSLSVEIVLKEALEAISLRNENVSPREINWLFEAATGLSRLDRMSKIDPAIDEASRLRFVQMCERRMVGEPVQYILGEATFYGHSFRVNSSVLIPRPETERIIEWVLNESGLHPGMKLLDVGTGSGCIPITIALEKPGVECSGVDISAEALKVAKSNALALEAGVQFFEMDVFSPAFDSIGGSPFDIVISNPPYIPDVERATLATEVKDHEPELALFCGSDPLLFYKRISELAPELLKKGGKVAVEVHADFGVQVQSLFSEAGLRKVNLINDLSGRERIVVAEVD